MSFARFSPRSRMLLLCALAAAAPACRDKPQELSSPVSSAPSAPVVAPLVYELPGTWTKMGESQVGSARAGYKIPKAGADAEEADLLVMFFGTGSQGDADKNFKDWLDGFDGGTLEKADKTSFDSPAGKVDTVEFNGTYKVPLGPAMGPKKKSPMQMVKEHWRMYGAVVHTKDRGNWFFKLTGPDETVQSAKTALRASLEQAR